MLLEFKSRILTAAATALGIAACAMFAGPAAAQSGEPIKIGF